MQIYQPTKDITVQVSDIAWVRRYVHNVDTGEKRIAIHMKGCEAIILTQLDLNDMNVSIDEEYDYIVSLLEEGC